MNEAITLFLIMFALSIPSSILVMSAMLVLFTIKEKLKNIAGGKKQ